jgi:hypothetical protein
MKNLLFYIFLLPILVSCNAKDNTQKQTDNTVTNVEVEENVEIREEKKKNATRIWYENQDADIYETEYTIINNVYNSIHRKNIIFEASVEFIKNSINYFMLTMVYYDEEYEELLNKFEWLKISGESFEITGIQNGKDDFLYSNGGDEYENAYIIINDVHNSIRPYNFLFDESEKFVDNAIRDILINYGIHDDRVKKLLDRFDWLNKIESPDKKLTGYSYYLYTGGTLHEYRTILIYAENTASGVYSCEELFSTWGGYELFEIKKIEDNIYLLEVGMFGGGFMVSGGCYCIDILREKNKLKLVPKNVFNGDHSLTYYCYVGDVVEFGYDESGKTINISMKDLSLQMKYKDGVFLGDYAKYGKYKTVDYWKSHE